MNKLVFILPRYHTAIAEWLACVIYIILMKRRYGNKKTCAILALAFPLLTAVNIAGEKVPIFLWIPFMLLGMGIMYILLWRCCDMPAMRAGDCWCRAFMAAELAASLEWQINYYIFLISHEFRVEVSVICMLCVYLIFFSVMFIWEKRQSLRIWKEEILVKELISALIIAVTAFLISNFSFAFRDSTFSASLGAGMLSVRTLVDFAGLLMLYAHQEFRRENYFRYELEATANLFQRQYEQYQQYKSNHEQIRRMYHDLKHQVDMIRSEKDGQKKEEYLEDISRALQIYEMESQTGNRILDTILSARKQQCADSGIRMVVFADAEVLDFIDVMDLCSIFGNALDNAIESVSKLQDKEKRMIKVSVFQKNSFVIIQFENYFESVLKMQKGLPETTKSNAAFHGIGMKSMRAIAEKYGGSLTINAENNWFTVTLLMPVPRHE